MYEDRNFLEAVQANPDEIQMRLVYADWLEEKGDERCEFVRLHLILRGVILHR